jgi:hypothetical protein
MSLTTAAVVKTAMTPSETNELASTARFEEAFVLPVQLSHAPRGVLLPEHRLMLAVLQEAVQTFQRSAASRGKRDRRLFGEVKEWFFATRGVGPFAFENICAVLRFDPDYIRDGLTRWVSVRFGPMPEALPQT